MKTQLSILGAGALVASAVIATAAIAQPPAPPAPPSTAGAFASSASEKPNFVSIPMEITVNKPAAEVWARVGKFCDIGEWLLRNPAGCTYRLGKGNDVGAQRSVGNEVLVAKTDLSYAYTQPVQAGRFYNLYHGNLEAKPLTATTSKLVYTLMYDNSQIAGDDAAKAAEMQRRRTQFEGALANMKILAEGGTLPPAPARGAAPGGAAPAGGRPAGAPPAPGR